MEELISGVARKDPQPRGLRRRQHRGAGDLLEEVLPHRGGQLEGAGGKFDPVVPDYDNGTNSFQLQPYKTF